MMLLALFFSKTNLKEKKDEFSKDVVLLLDFLFFETL